ncbi:MAG TPA: hypothetical protein VLD58_10055, partial [Gemmatimonadales bacterium]|nr:hypothetical protein [Gemmatimonadales bacterium]
LGDAERCRAVLEEGGRPAAVPEDRALGPGAEEAFGLVKVYRKGDLEDQDQMDFGHACGAVDDGRA